MGIVCSLNLAWPHCSRKRRSGDIRAHKYGYQVPDRTTLYIQICPDLAWQDTKRQTSSDSVPFHAPASYYLTGPVTLHSIFHPFIFTIPLSPESRQAHHKCRRFSQGEICMHIKHIGTFNVSIFWALNVRKTAALTFYLIGFIC